ncbi:hypothetical protein JW960_05455 [candidate division KSB1 bacterium]|nr:hypothetical protein [candidate division KSB1 bacterium]
MLMIRIKMPHYEMPEIVVDQLIDTNLIVKQMEMTTQDEVSKISTPEKKQKHKQIMLETKTPSLLGKIDITDIINQQASISKSSFMPDNTNRKLNIQQVEKIALPELTNSKDDVVKGLDILVKKFSTQGRELPIGVRSADKTNLKLAVSEGNTAVKENTSYQSYGQVAEFDAPGNDGDSDYPLFQVGYVPEKNVFSYELKKVIQWIVDHNMELPGHVNRFLQKKDGDATTKVQFQIGKVKYTMFLRATPIVGDEEIAFAICHGDRVALLIDQGADQKDDMLRVGNLMRNARGEIVGFKSTFKSFTYTTSGLYSRIFWAWWKYETQNAKK